MKLDNNLPIKDLDKFQIWLANYFIFSEIGNETSAMYFLEKLIRGCKNDVIKSS